MKLPSDEDIKHFKKNYPSLYQLIYAGAVILALAAGACIIYIAYILLK
jgi:hypothetical protein